MPGSQFIRALAMVAHPQKHPAFRLASKKAGGNGMAKNTIGTSDKNAAGRR